MESTHRAFTEQVARMIQTKTDEADVQITTGNIHKWLPWFGSLFASVVIGTLAYAQLGSNTREVDMRHTAYEQSNDRYLAERRAVNERWQAQTEARLTAMESAQKESQRVVSEMKAQLDVAVAILKRIDERAGKP